MYTVKGLSGPYVANKMACSAARREAGNDARLCEGRSTAVAVAATETASR